MKQPVRKVLLSAKKEKTLVEKIKSAVSELNDIKAGRIQARTFDALLAEDFSLSLKRVVSLSYLVRNDISF